MPLAERLDAPCKNCGESEVLWWSEVETEDTLEVYASCDACGREFPKKFVSRSEDTSHDALKQIALDRAT